jgi:NOL1/NOP2/fmu family ribosome biogenesis protein
LPERAIVGCRFRALLANTESDSGEVPADEESGRGGWGLGRANPGGFEQAHAPAHAMDSGDAQDAFSLDVDEAERCLPGRRRGSAEDTGWMLVGTGEWQP